MPVHLFGLSADMDPIHRRGRARRHSGHRGRRAGDRRDLQGAAGRRHRRVRLLLVLSEQEPRRLRRRRPARRPTTTRWRSGRGCCARTAWSRSTTTTWSARNFRMDALQAAVLRVKAPHLAAGPRRAARTRRAIARCSARPGSTIASRCRSSRADRRHIFNQFVIRTADRDGLKRHLDDARHRQRDLLSGAVPSAAVLRRSRLPRAATSRTPSAPRPRAWRFRSTAS